LQLQLLVIWEGVNFLISNEDKFVVCVWTLDVGENIKVTGRWRKLHNQELRALSSLPDITELIK
jgi:hypothetical protein